MDATCTVCEEAVLRSIIREFDELVWALIVTWSRAAVPADRPLLAAEGFGADAAALLAFPSVPAFALSQANNVLRFSILTVRILEGLLVNSTLGKATNIVPGERPPPACTQRMPRYRRDFFLDASRCISVSVDVRVFKAGSWNDFSCLFILVSACGAPTDALPAAIVCNSSRPASRTRQQQHCSLRRLESACGGSVASDQND
jgi:hypothetical protein